MERGKKKKRRKRHKKGINGAYLTLSDRHSGVFALSSTTEYV